VILAEGHGVHLGRYAFAADLLVGHSMGGWIGARYAWPPGGELAGLVQQLDCDRLCHADRAQSAVEGVLEALDQELQGHRDRFHASVMLAGWSALERSASSPRSTIVGARAMRQRRSVGCLGMLRWTSWI
jgi:pimeloyl-ACP methyl ester carboxylesterase